MKNSCINSGVPRKKKIYAPQGLLIIFLFEILPSAKNTLNNSAVKTESIESDIVVSVAFSSAGIHSSILCKVSIRTPRSIRRAAPKGSPPEIFFYLGKLRSGFTVTTLTPLVTSEPKYLVAIVAIVPS